MQHHHPNLKLHSDFPDCPNKALSLQAQVAIKGQTQHLVVMCLQSPLSGTVPQALHSEDVPRSM